MVTRMYVCVGGSRNGQAFEIDEELGGAVVLPKFVEPPDDPMVVSFEPELYTFRQVHLMGRVFEVLVAKAYRTTLAPEDLLQALLTPDAYASWEQGRRAEVAPW